MTIAQMVVAYLSVGVLYAIWDGIRDRKTTMMVCNNIMRSSPPQEAAFAAMLIATSFIMWYVACTVSWPYQAYTDTERNRRKARRGLKGSGLL
jgi:hypothetical protein